MALNDMGSLMSSSDQSTAKGIWSAVNGCALAAEMTVYALNMSEEVTKAERKTERAISPHCAGSTYPSRVSVRRDAPPSAVSSSKGMKESAPIESMRAVLSASEA